MPKAAPSTRSSGHVNISFGLLNIACTLYAGTVSAHGIQRREYHSVPVLEDDGNGGQRPKLVKVEKDDGTFEEVPVVEDHPVGRGVIDKMTGELIDQSQVLRKVETEYGPVYVEDHEIEKLFEITPDSIVIKEFQPLHLFHQGHYVPKTQLFIQPRVTGTGKKKGPDPIANKLLHTLLEGMKSEGALAVVETTTRGIPKPGILTPDGVLWHVWHTDALREAQPLPECDTVPAEVAMLRQLIKTKWSTDPLDLSDERSALIQAFADEKAAAGDFGKPAEEQVVVVEQAVSTDLMALLAASVEAAKPSKPRRAVTVREARGEAS